MHPATPHIVVTTKSCIAVGSHFYNLDTVHESFSAIVAEHFVGMYVTNTEHPRAPLLYFKAVDALFQQLVLDYEQNGGYILALDDVRGTFLFLQS